MKATFLSMKASVALFTLASACASCSFFNGIVSTPPPTVPFNPQTESTPTLQMGPAATPTIAPSEIPLASASPTAPFLPPGLSQITTANAGNLQQIAEIPVSGVISLSFSPDGRLLAILSQHATDRSIFVTLWDMNTGAAAYILDPWDGFPTSLFSQQGDFLVSLLRCPDRTFIWDPSSAQKMALLPMQFTCAGFSPDMGSLVVRSSYDNNTDVSTVKFIRTSDAGELHSMYIVGYLKDIVFSPDNLLVALSTGGGYIALPTTVYDFSTGELVATLNDVYGVDFSPDGKWIAGMYQDGDQLNVVRTSDWNSVTLLRTASGGTSFNHPIFSPDGSLLAAPDSYRLVLWDTVHWKDLNTISNNVSGYDFSPDGRIIATGGYAGSITLWGILP